MLIWMGLSFAAGLVVGWTLLPMPEWVKMVYGKLNHWYNLVHNFIARK
jgi:hypothetical protein